MCASVNQSYRALDLCGLTTFCLICSFSFLLPKGGKQKKKKKGDPKNFTFFFLIGSLYVLVIRRGVQD